MHKAAVPLLTIAIPTYNRSRFLDRLLNSLTAQLVNESRVELLISDNASPDETPAIIQAHSQRGLAFRSIRNATNIGGDGNVVQCFTEASGKYVWIIGDDDVVLPGGLATILNLLTQDEYDIVHLQALDIREGDNIPSGPKRPKMRVIQEPREFVLRTHVFLTFITGNIINKERVLSIPHPVFADSIGTILPQLSWVYPVVRHFRKGAHILDPLIAVGADDRGGYALFTVFGTNFKHLTETLLVTPELVRIVLNGTLQVFFPTFVLRSTLQEGAFIGESPEDILTDLFSNNYRYYLFLYPLLKLPARMGKLWLLVVRIINRLDKALGNPMLR